MYTDQTIMVPRDNGTVDELTLEETYREYMTNTDYPGAYEMIDKAISYGALKEEVPDKASAINWMIENTDGDVLIWEIDHYGGIITVYNFLASGMTEEEYADQVAGKVMKRGTYPGSYKGSAELNIYFLKNYLIWRETGEFADDYSYPRSIALQWPNQYRMKMMLKRKKAGK